MYLQKTRRLLYNQNGVKKKMLSVTNVRQFYLGVQGENEEQTITVDVRPWLASYPNGVVSIWHKRNGESVPTQTGATFDPEEGTITWVPTYTDTYVAGEGEAEVRLYDNGVIKKTRKVKTGVAPSVTGAAGVTLESGWQGYINYIDDQAQAAIGAKEDAEDAKEDAQAAQTAAETAQGLAEAAQLGAENAQTAAETAQGKAEGAQEAAETAQGLAEAAQEAAETAQGLAETAQEAAETAQGLAEDAQDAAEEAAAHYPYIDDTTENWMVWDAEEEQFVDTGILAQGEKGDTGATPEISVGTVTTLQPDEQATVELDESSTAAAPVFNFGIPKGETGQAGNVYGNTIDMSSSDSTKVSAAINAKLAAPATAGTSGQVLTSDGNGGQAWADPTGGAEIDDTAGSGATTKAWSADKLTTEFGKKADKVSSATNGNFAALDSNGNLTDSGHKHSDYLTSHQDISGKADKVSSATENNFAALDRSGNLKDSGHKHSDYLTSHQDISGKADKVSSATNGNFAGLDSNGNLTDSGHKHSDYLTSHQDISGKANKNNTVLTSYLSRGRKSNTTTGTASFAFGGDVEASGMYSHAEGSYTTASSNSAHAEGGNTTASGGYSHAEGIYTTASKEATHAEGYGTTASGHSAHAEGYGTTATGHYSHSEGNYTKANHKAQHVFGEYNVEDASTAATTARGNYVEVVGNGTGTGAKSNARALDWSGNEYLNGDLYFNCNDDSSGGTSVSALAAAGVVESFTIEASDWASTSPYTYTWTNAHVTANCRVEVDFADGVTAEMPYIEYEKVSGGIQFTAPSLPTDDIQVVVTIDNVQQSAVTSVTGSMVTTSAVSGAANVDEALGVLNGRIKTYNVASSKLTFTLSVPAGTRYFICACGSNVTTRNMVGIIHCTNGSEVVFFEVSKGSDLTVTTATGTITITRSSGSMQFFIIPLSDEWAMPTISYS